jgi:hypothetical protein
MMNSLAERRLKLYQVAVHASGMPRDLETTPFLPAITNVSMDSQQQNPKMGVTMSAHFFVIGPKLYVDVAWKPRPNQTTVTIGLGVYFEVTELDAALMSSSLPLLRVSNPPAG